MSRNMLHALLLLVVAKIFRAVKLDKTLPTSFSPGSLMGGILIDFKVK